jgi:hypothetical protein
VVAVLIPVGFLYAESHASARTRQIVGTTYGAVAGRVMDPSGGALAGVTVRLSSTALMQPRETVTTDDGRYLFAALPPSVYTVTFERSGFRPASVEVQVGTGFSANADAILRIAERLESVIVGRSSVIDRHSTAIVVSFTAAQLATLPGSRSVFAILSLTPGVQVSRFEVGGNTGDAGGQYSAYGTRGANRPMVEGISVAQLFPLGFTLDYGAFEEVSVGLAAHGPEWPLPGVQMQFVGKVGGNQYRGTAYGDFEHRHWQSHNIDADQQQRTRAAGAGLLSPEANRMWRYYDVNADLGGFIARERAWWYGSVRDQDVQIRQVNFPVTPSRTRLNNYTGKLTLRAGDGHNFIAFAQGGRNYQPTRLDPFGPVVAGGQIFNSTSAIHETEDATSTQRAAGIVWKTEWNGTFGDRVFAEARVGQFEARRPLRPNGDAPRFEDVDTLRVSGGGRHIEQRLRRNQVHGSLSYFKEQWAGSHHFKLGGEILETLSEEGRPAAFRGDVLHVLRSGEPAEVYLFVTPSASASGVLSAAAHAGDTWRVSDRLTFNVGVRFDRHGVFLPAQEHPRGGPEGGPIVFAAVDDIVQWHQLAPRVGGVFDISGDHKTIVKGSYARYWLAPADLGPNVNPNPAEWWRRHLWNDANRSGRWEPGEEGFLRDSRGGRTVESIDPHLRAPWTDEATAWLERELPGVLGLRTGVVWRRDAARYARQNTARPFEAFTERVPVTDPGPDGLRGTPDDGPGFFGYNLRLDPSSPTAIVNVVRNVDGSESRYLTWEIAAHRRRHGRWSLSAGFAHTWTLEHSNTYSGQAIRPNPLVLTPNDLINTEGGRHRLRTWTATASGTLQAPWRIAVTPLMRHQSGQPFGRTISTEMNFGVIRVLAEPIGTRRMDNVTLLDIRLERELRRSGSRRVTAFLDVFNLFNANPEQNVNWSSGPGFLQPLTIVSPRIARIGVSAAF